MLESRPAGEQTIDGFKEALEIIDQRNAIVCGFDSSMEPGIEGHNFCNGFGKGRGTLVEIRYRDLQLLLSQRASNFWRDGSVGIGRAGCFQVIQLTQDVTD